jgi:hypothetical protein
MGLEAEVDTKDLYDIGTYLLAAIQFETPKLLQCVSVILVWHLQ